MNSKFLTALTLATVTFLSFSSIAKAESTAQIDGNTPELTAVIQDGTQTITDANPSSETVDSPKTTKQYSNSSRCN
jgi:peptidoglycan hydrolase CwlO-like protein